MEATLRLLSYNIHVGIAAPTYGRYLSSLWQHLLPSASRLANLHRIAHLCAPYDLVGLQEVDSGSWRSGFASITETLAELSHHPHHLERRNRNFGPLAKHSLGLLSRFPLHMAEHHRLPSLIPGRGMLVARMDHRLTVAVTHLALNRRQRLSQLDYISDCLAEYEHVILMGDFNFHERTPEMRHLLSRTNLQLPEIDMHSYPSWKPRAKLDHILVSPTLRVIEHEVIAVPYSDHLPVSMTIALPADIRLELS